VLSNHPELVNTVNGYNVPLLHLAAEQGDEKLVRLLLKRGADRDMVDTAGYTLLHRAAAGDLLFLIQEELVRGILVYTRAAGGIIPLHLAIKNRHVKAVRLLLDRGADLEAEAYSGCSPLYLAVQSGYPAVVNLLLGKGTDVNHGDDWGATPLHFSALYQQPNVLSMLLGHGHEIDKKNGACMVLKGKPWKPD
jgi:ankyrin repeat protein